MQSISTSSRFGFLLLRLGVVLATGWWPVVGFGQLPGPSRAFSARELRASPNVYALASDTSGLVYAANNEGLAVYDASTWVLVPTKSPVRAVAVQPSGRIVIGGVASIGYFSLDANQRLLYHDLVETLPVEARKFQEVVKLVAAGTEVYALTATGLVAVDQTNEALPRLQPVALPQPFALTASGDEAYAVAAQGLVRLRNGRAELVADLPLEASSVLAFAKLPSGWAFLSLDGRLRIVNAQGGLEQTLGISDQFGGGDLAVDAAGGLWIAAGTSGFWHLPVGATSVKPITTPGLGVALSVHVAQTGIVWFGHSKGVLQVRPNGIPVVSLGEDVQVSQLAAQGGVRLAATTNGSFLLRDQPVAIADFSRTVYDVLAVGPEQFVVLGEEGVALVDREGKRLDRLRVPGIRGLVSRTSGTLYVGNRTAIRQARIAGDELKLDSLEVPVPAPVGSLAEDADGTIWVGTFGAGLHLLAGGKLSQPDGLPTSGTVQLMRVGDQVLVRIQSTYYRLVNKQLSPLPSLSREAGTNSFFLTTSGNQVVVSTLRGLRLFELQGDSLRLIPQSVAYTRTVQPSAAAFDGQALVVAYDSEIQTYPQPLSVPVAKALLVRSAYLVGADSILSAGLTAQGTTGYRTTSSLQLELPRDAAGLRLQVALPDYDNSAATVYRHRIDASPWTEWSPNATLELTNLPYGAQIIEVQARHPSGYVSQATIGYQLPAPLYLSTGFLILYGLLFIGLVWASVRLYSRRLEQQNHRLEMIVQERTQEISEQKVQIEQQLQQLAEQHDKLELTLEELKATQEQLLQTEKMAALGQLVAGVAHEINTPVGVGVTAASHLQVRSKEIGMLLETGQMKKSDLTRFIEMSNEGTQIILQNLSRAADLIQSFKKVAVDQNVEEATIFDLKSYLGDILLSVRPKMKENGVTAELEAPDQLEMVSFASALSQVMINLLMNAMIHAFEERGGKIQITATALGTSQVLIKVADNGKGIPEEIRPRIFDPFFTTNRGKGGSGLGLHIVFNLVTQSLKGTIQVESTVGVGTTFSLTLPKAL